MKVSIISSQALKDELINQCVNNDHEITWLENHESIQQADVLIDLLFEPSKIDQLKNANAQLVIVNGVDFTLADVPENFCRINAWPTFLKNKLIEISVSEIHFNLARDIFSSFGKKIEQVPDIKGFITPRVVSMIINEAYFALEENVSTKNEIDLAMKLGTNYPYGPFEWSEKIGLNKIYTLLDALSQENLRYTPAPLLKKELI